MHSSLVRWWMLNNIAVYILVSFFLATVEGLRKLSPTLIETELRKHGIIPDIIDEKESPGSLIKIIYTYKDRNDTREVDFGNELLPMDLYYYPNIVEWPGLFETYYALFMIDADAPSRDSPSQREYCNWLLVNVPGNELYIKETLFDYVGPRPRQGTGFHRFIFMVYEQPVEKNFSEPRLYQDHDDVRRTRFSTRDFVKKYKLGKMAAVNFFYAQVI